jgi:hypothetical protein
MSMPFIADTPGFESTSWAQPDEIALERSSLVAICVSLIACGALMASSGEHSLPGLPFALPLLAVTIEEEVRRFRIPSWLGLSTLALYLGWLYSTDAGAAAVLLALSSAIVFPALLLPLYGAGFVRLGSLATGAALGAIWGMDALPGIVFWAVALGLPFSLVRIAFRANPRTLPLLTSLGFAAAMQQLFH